MIEARKARRSIIASPDKSLDTRSTRFVLVNFGGKGLSLGTRGLTHYYWRKVAISLIENWLIRSRSGNACFSASIGLSYRTDPVKFDHLQHGVTEFLMQKFAVNSPSPALVKVDSPNIGLDHPKVDNVMATAAYFTFCVVQ